MNIWAKPNYLLTDHSRDVYHVALYLFGTEDQPTQFAKNWFRFFRLEPEQIKPFYATLHAACLLHDVGKANYWMQKMLRGEEKSQALRHERISAMIIHDLRNWISSFDGVDYEVCLAAVCGHHLKAKPGEQGDNAWCSLHNSDFTAWEVYPKGVTDVLKTMGEVLGVVPPFYKPQEYWEWEKGGKERIEEIEKVLKKFSRVVKKDENRLRLLSAVRSALILCDGAGSGLARMKYDLKEWINNAFSDYLTPDYIDEKIINPRLKGRPLFDFQRDAVNFPDKSGILAPCAAGKTICGYRFARGWIEKRPIARVIFLYPTRGTATEGFRTIDDKKDCALMHGTSAYELSNMLMELDLAIQPDFAKMINNNDGLYKIGYWMHRLFIATVDQFLGFMQNKYQSMCYLPIIAESVVIVDEVHTFDDRLFSALCRFIEFFDIPVIVMTATLPLSKKSQLENCGVHFFPET